VIFASLSIASMLMTSILSSFSFGNKPFSIATQKKESSYLLHNALSMQEADSSIEQLQLFANDSTIRLMIEVRFDNCSSYRFTCVAKGSSRSLTSRLFLRLNFIVSLP